MKAHCRFVPPESKPVSLDNRCCKASTVSSTVVGMLGPRAVGVGGPGTFPVVAHKGLP
jgi:hypothetical protein